MTRLNRACIIARGGVRAVQVQASDPRATGSGNTAKSAIPIPSLDLPAGHRYLEPGQGLCLVPRRWTAHDLPQRAVQGGPIPLKLDEGCSSGGLAKPRSGH